jgi:hypothetical protein
MHSVVAIHQRILACENQKRLFVEVSYDNTMI